MLKLKSISPKTFVSIIPIIVFIFIVVLGELYISAQEQEFLTRQKNNLLLYSSTLRSKIEQEFNALLYLNSGLASYLIVRKDTLQEKEITDILSLLFHSSQYIRNFGVAVGYRLTYIYPNKGNESAVGLNYQELPDQWPMIEKIVMSGRPALVGPQKLVQGGIGLIYRVPMYIDGKYWGLLSTVIDVESLLKAIADLSQTQRFTYAIRSKNILGIEGQPLTGDQSLFQSKDSFVQQIEIPGGHWQIATKNMNSNQPLILKIGSRTISLLFAAVIAYMHYRLMKAQKEMAKLAMFDSLTELPSRRLMDDRFKIAIARHQRNRHKICALVFLDLDGFKKINDSSGHKAGDIVLKTTAHRLQTMVRTYDTIARWGGDEFLLLFENISHEDLEIVLHRLRECVEKPIDFDGHQLIVGASMGLATYPEDGTDLDAVLKVADQKMYLDKMSRKNGR